MTNRPGFFIRPDTTNAFSLDASGNLTLQTTAVTNLTDAGQLALTDIDALNRSGTDLRTTMASRITLFRKTPAGSRTAPLPAILTAADHDKNVLLSGTTGTLTVDGTVADGFRCHVINGATGTATFSGITGIPNAVTSLVSGGICTVMTVGTASFAGVPSSGSSSSATAYSMTQSANSGLGGSPVTLTFSPSGGAWPAGLTLTPAVSGVTGAFGPATISPTAGSSNTATAAFTPTSAGTAIFSITNNGGLSNPANLTYAVNAVATAFTTSLSVTSGNVGSPVTITFAPTSNPWPAGETITPTASGVAGTFNPPAVACTAGSTSPATCTFTPTATGTATISSTNSDSLANTTGNLTYTSNPVNAAVYTMAESATSGLNGSAVTLTFTPTGGSWPGGATLTPAVSGVTGTFSPATVSPTAGSASAVSCSFTPSTTGTATFSVTNTAALTNPGSLTYTVNVVTQAYTTSLSASSGNANTPVTVTFTPTSGYWPAGETITPAVSGVAGTFNPSSISASGSGAVACTFTPTAAGTATLSSNTSPSLTNTTGNLTYTAAASAPGYVSLPSTGVNGYPIALVAHYDGSVGVTSSGGTVTALADQSGNGNNLTATSGVTVGPAIGQYGLASESFASNAASGLLSTANNSSTGWLAQTFNPASHPANWTVALVLKFSGAQVTTGYEWMLCIAQGTTDYYHLNLMYDASNVAPGGNAGLYWLDRGLSTTAARLISGVPSAGVHRIIVRTTFSGTGSVVTDAWVDGTKQASIISSGSATYSGLTDLAIGAAPHIGNYAPVNEQFCEAYFIRGGLNDSDVTTLDTNLASRWS